MGCNCCARAHTRRIPRSVFFDHWWLVNRVEGQEMTPSPAGGPDLPVADAPHEHIQYGEKTLGTTADQDLSIAEMQQKGLASAGYQGILDAESRAARAGLFTSI
jgi:hypothetical protein